ncbi:hypothetical protein, partial [Sphingobacterium sp.]|uniref:hypothetical protein n=1 Tax=Sphingobacterium sp. TaxID=341027 RepID=UPI002899B1EF
MQQAVKKLSEEFAKYNKESLISKLGALALFPENHSKKNRIRAALQAAICSKENGRKGDQISNSTLAGLLEQYFTPDEQIWQFEDPQEVLFTEIIKFHGGNFIIFPEVLADSHMALNLLLDFIFMEENNIPITFKKEVFYAAKSLLNMSNKIAQIMGFERYQNSPYSHHEPIFFGDLELMDKACNAINFRYDLVVGRNRVGFEQRANTLEWFICYEKSQMIEDDDLERIPLQTKPLSRFGDLLIVNQVASIPV